MKVFVSHGAKDTWIAKQIVRCIQDLGADTFVDAYDVLTGDEFEARIKEGLRSSDEIVALVTSVSTRRAWVLEEIGAMWIQDKRISAVLYGLDLKDLEHESGAGLLSTRHVRDLNKMDAYLEELRVRIQNA